MILSLASLTTRRWLLGCGGLLLAVVGLLSAGGGYAYHLWNTVPAGWQEVEHHRSRRTPQDRAALAARVENRVMSALSSTPSSPAPSSSVAFASESTPDVPAVQTLTLSNEEINVWLEHRLPLWAANQNVPLPEEIHELRYWPEADQPVVAAQIALEDVTQVVSIVFDLELRDDGKARLRLHDVRGGRLPMPTRRFVDRTIEDLQERSASQKVQDIVDLLHGHWFDPVVPIDQTRCNRLTGFTVEPQGITLRYRRERFADR